MRFESFVAFRLCFSFENLFASRTVLIAMLTVCFSTLLPVVVLSVVNGFHQELREKILASNFVVRITPRYGYFSDTAGVVSFLESYPSVKEVTPFFENYALLRLKNAQEVFPVHIKALPHHFLSRNRTFNKHFRILAPQEYPLFSTRLPQTTPKQYFSFQSAHQIIIGEALAQWLGASVRSEVELVIPSADLSGFSTHAFQSFFVSDLFSAGYAEYNKHLVFLHEDAPMLVFDRPRISALGVSLDSDASYVALEEELGVRYPDLRFHYSPNDSIFRGFAQEKLAMLCLMFFLILCSCVTMYIAMLVLVLHKTRDIGVLKTLGVSSQRIEKVFVVQGFLLGCMAVFVGNVLGFFLTISLHQIITALESLVNHSVSFALQYLEFYFAVESLFGYQPPYHSFEIMSKTAFYMSQFPFQFRYPDILFFSSTTIFLSVLASYFPAKKIAQQKILHALRFGK